MDYTSIDNDGALIAQTAVWAGKERLAVDFEGEFNLHIYGEHLCLVQIYDGERFFLVDPRSEGITKKGLEAFFSSPVEKVWFDVQSDASLVYKNYGMRISNVFDVRSLAMSLGDMGNLSAVEEKYLGLHAETAKKKRQTSNWLTRPISQENVEYALSDVAHLIDLKAALEAEVRKQRKEKEAARLLEKAVQVKKPDPAWTKLPGWRNLSQEERIYAKHFFQARDKVARRFNVPAVRVLDKHRLTEFAIHPPKDLRKALEGENPRYLRFLLEAMEAALALAEKEAGAGKGAS